jgi:hypothetical protein
MNDVHIFKIGPIDDAGACLYVPVSPARTLEVADATDDADGITKIVEQWPDGRFQCSPDLEAAAEQLGIPVAPLEAATEGTRISTALSIAQSPDFDGIVSSWSVLVLMRGMSQFVDAGAVERWPPKLAIDIELRGDRELDCHGVLLTAPYPGVVLFTDHRDAKACALLDGEEQQAFIAERDHLRVQLEPGPEYVIEWIRDFYDIECMPRVLKRRGGENVLADDEDALVVGGVLSALAAVEDVRETTYAETRTPGRQVRTFVSPGGPWPLLQVPGTT